MEKEHKERLRTLWVKLLDNITDFNSIIDGLFAKQILTVPIKEKILQKKGSDQLREILDILPKRGPRAFDVFYQVLVDCGEEVAADLLCPELAAQRQSQAATHSRVIPGVQESSRLPSSLPEDDELPTKWPDPDNKDHDIMRMDVTKVSEGEMKARFDKAVAGDETVYTMHNKPTRGIFLLISNYVFKGDNLEFRNNAGRDTYALQKLFEQLHFKVVMKVNLNANDMMKVVQTQAAEVEATDNCFAFAVLSHGEDGKVYGADGETVALEDLTAAVKNCQMLIGKPKIFFIQACQGKKVDNAAAAGGGKGDAGSNPQGKDEIEAIQELTKKMTDVSIEEENQSDAAPEQKVSSKSDTYVAMATNQGDLDSSFVQAVIFIFSHFAHKYEINQLMTRVNRLVKICKGCDPVCVPSSSLTKDLYFFPDLPRDGGQ